MDLEPLIVQVLADAPEALTSHQIAKRCRQRFSGHVSPRLSGQQVHTILSGRLRPLVSVTPSYKWSLLGPETSRAIPSSGVSSDATAGCRADRQSEGDEHTEQLRANRALLNTEFGEGPEIAGPRDDAHGPYTDCPGAFLILDDDEWFCG